MDEIVEEIALVPSMTQNQDDDELFHDRKIYLSIQVLKSRKHLKEFLLWIILFFCILFIGTLIGSYITSDLPEVKKRTISTNLFSEERARDYLINLTQFGSRVSNTRGQLHARDYLILQIQRICSFNKKHSKCELDLQNLTDPYQYRLQNILVRVSNPMTRTKNVSSLMLSAHFDTVEFSPGSSDDGSGIVILLELLSNFVNDVTMNFSDVHLIILFTNAEEIASQGAEAFIANHKWKTNIRRFINIDAASCNEKANLVRAKPSQLVIDYSQVSRPRANVIFEYISKRAGLIGDYDTFVLNGSLKGYDFGFILDGYIYHTSLDTPAMIKEGVLQDLGENLRILIRNILLGKINLEEKENLNDNDPLIYFDILGRYLMIYKMSTSTIVQRILILLIVSIGIPLILIDDKWHRQRSLTCNHFHCIYFYFKYSFNIRILSIILYFISNSISILTGFLFSMGFASFLVKYRPVLWFGSSTLAILLYSFPYFIGFILIGYIFNFFHRFILRKSFKNNSTIDIEHLNDVHFDFEQNFSILLNYIVLMIISIHSENRLLYIILVWSIFICPMYLFLMIIEFLIHWKQIHINFFEKKHHWLLIPLLISLFPLTYTIESMNRLIRILLPLLARRFTFGWAYRTNMIICCFITIPITFLILLFIPILQRTKQFLRILILLLITFFLIFIFALIRQPFSPTHPNVFYAKHTSKTVFMVEKFPDSSLNISHLSQTSMITVTTYDDIRLSSLLDQFSTKSGVKLSNKRCSRSTSCVFDDTFNRTISIQNIEIKPLKNRFNYTILIRHVLTSHIQISSFPSIYFLIRNQFNVPRTETIIDIMINSTSSPFDIDIRIRRCNLNDSPFLLLFTRLMTNVVLMGKGQCQSIEDDATLIFAPNTLSNKQL